MDLLIYLLQDFDEIEIAKLKSKGLKREKITNCVNELVELVANCLSVTSIKWKTCSLIIAARYLVNFARVCLFVCVGGYPVVLRFLVLQPASPTAH